MRSRQLSLIRKTSPMAALLLLLPSAAVRAQTSMTAFLPEIDSYFRVTPNVRLVFDAKGYMEDGDLNHVQIGPSLQFNTQPLANLKQSTSHGMDDMKPMPVVFTIGYRHLPSSVQPVVGWGMLPASRYPIVLFGWLHLLLHPSTV